MNNVYTKIKRKRNGIPTKMTTIRIDEDLLEYMRKINFNLSEWVNVNYRKRMEYEQEKHMY